MAPDEDRMILVVIVEERPDRIDQCKHAAEGTARQAPLGGRAEPPFHKMQVLARLRHKSDTKARMPIDARVDLRARVFPIVLLLDATHRTDRGFLCYRNGSLRPISSQGHVFPCPP